jgi:hypothetical protein
LKLITFFFICFSGGFVSMKSSVLSVFMIDLLVRSLCEVILLLEYT